eukprot:TRINITY_DN39520_c0_g1_i1.p1 TRINITY_DN39520_c0_g1~~TRINITY_DN39520_c0_g1_i1.p1  ORF type:complete len:117 (+),score=15.65 TRINITY_DN39520_c0_g1_i1:75-425(+)
MRLAVVIASALQLACFARAESTASASLSNVSDFENADVTTNMTTMPRDPDQLQAETAFEVPKLDESALNLTEKASRLRGSNCDCCGCPAGCWGWCKTDWSSPWGRQHCSGQCKAWR